MNKWANSDDLRKKEVQVQAKISKQSSQAIQYFEVLALVFSFVFLLLWLIEKLFNPDWPIW
jgi:flagellar biogenesis protein FliO